MRTYFNQLKVVAGGSDEAPWWRLVGEGYSTWSKGQDYLDEAELDEGDFACWTENIESGWFCNRLINHKGDHISYSEKNITPKILDRWSD